MLPVDLIGGVYFIGSVPVLHPEAQTVNEMLDARDAAVLWALVQRTARTYLDATKRAKHANGGALFGAILDGKSGVVFTEDAYNDAWNYVTHDDNRFPLIISELIDILAGLDPASAIQDQRGVPVHPRRGQRGPFTANTIIHDDTWRLKDKSGTLRISRIDADTLGLTDDSTARITTNRGSALATIEIDDRLQPGHAALPNGFGLDPTADGSPVNGVALNQLTDDRRRDPSPAPPGTRTSPPASKPSRPQRTPHQPLLSITHANLIDLEFVMRRFQQTERWADGPLCSAADPRSRSQRRRQRKLLPTTRRAGNG